MNPVILEAINGIAAVLNLIPHLIEVAEALRKIQASDPEVSEATMNEAFAELDAAIKAAKEA